MKIEAIHRRRNPLTGQSVLVSPHRNNRPWLGAVESGNDQVLPVHDQGCPLCPGNARAGDEVNPDYTSTYVFNNDFAALNMSIAENAEGMASDDLFQSELVNGVSRVICFAPQHNLTLPELSHEQLLRIVATWVEQYNELAGDFNWVQIFENKGAIMGCSQPHPHGQIWAHDFLPSTVVDENENQSLYYEKHGSNMLLEYAQKESVLGERTIAENKTWIAVVPYWAAWPFETLLLPKTHIARLGELTNEEQNDLAAVLKELTTRYDNLFNCSFPYSMGWHGAPSRMQRVEHWQLHAHFYPPLLRSAEVKKHMVGYEMLAESQRDLTAEKAAALLQGVSRTHYKKQ